MTGVPAIGWKRVEMWSGVLITRGRDLIVSSRRFDAPRAGPVPQSLLEMKIIDPQNAYDELIGRSRAQAMLGSCSSVLGWDEQTYMPAGGAMHRGAQMALLAGLHHEWATDPMLDELLTIVEGSNLVAEPDRVPTVNVRALRRIHDRKRLLPRALVEELARTSSLAQPEWVAARASSDFGRFRPWLEKIVQLKREEAACLAPAFRDNMATDVAYDPLLDEYEPGAKSADLARVFQALQNELVPLAMAINEATSAGLQRRSESHPTRNLGGESILRRLYPRDRQRIFGETVAAAIGFDFERGRLDIAAHPFCSGIGPGDCRITTRFDEHQFSDAFFGILHEVGHGLYEQGLDQASYGTPMGEAVSLGVHESQSRLWENAVGRGRAFWRFWFPMAQRVFREALADVKFEEFHAAINHVAPSLIRVQADEVTYNLHIIVRFELERALVSGDLAVADVPGAWNERYQATLGVTPRNDAEGCLQDIHWSAGLFGYFPTYTLGNLYAAQLYARAEADLGGLDEAFSRGDFGGLLGWLRNHVHSQGQRYRPAELIERITGSAPDHRPLVNGLRQKYQELYRL
jgi:carboxypeptidase Taq